MFTEGYTTWSCELVTLVRPIGVKGSFWVGISDIKETLPTLKKNENLSKRYTSCCCYNDPGYGWSPPAVSSCCTCWLSHRKHIARRVSASKHFFSCGATHLACSPFFCCPLRFFLATTRPRDNLA